jgi:peptidoglycan/xylan/chitin deacetylase (PgdA/CDA1 family)
MSFCRNYSLSEVVQMLDASEHRPRPDKIAGAPGHAVGLHTTERRDVFSRPTKKKDSVFLVNRQGLAALVHEALNSPSGQSKLGELDSESCNSVEIRSIALRQGSGFDVLTVYRPKGKDAQTSFDWLSTTNGDGFIVQVFVLAVKIPGVSSELHIQTAFPEDYARTSGDTIVGR